MDKTASKNVAWVESPDGYLDRTPVLQSSMTSVLFAIFVEAIDLSFLETSADTYATLLGPKRLSTLRLNVAQTMNALGLLTGILLGKYLVFQDSKCDKYTPAQLKAMAEKNEA